LLSTALADGGPMSRPSGQWFDSTGAHPGPNGFSNPNQRGVIVLSIVVSLTAGALTGLAMYYDIPKRLESKAFVLLLVLMVRWSQRQYGPNIHN
jgi:hypothetical protein